MALHPPSFWPTAAMLHIYSWFAWTSWFCAVLCFTVAPWSCQLIKCLYLQLSGDEFCWETSSPNFCPFKERDSQDCKILEGESTGKGSTSEIHSYRLCQSRDIGDRGRILQEHRFAWSASIWVCNSPCWNGKSRQNTGGRFVPWQPYSGMLLIILTSSVLICLCKVQSMWHEELIRHVSSKWCAFQHLCLGVWALF